MDKNNMIGNIDMMDKINMIIEIEGYENEEDLINDIMCSSVNPGICMNDDCEYTTEVEPDCIDGYCELCDTNTVRSATDLLLF